MSGHSKWATTKHKKGAADAKRGVLFTKLANAISVAARQGGDPNTNFSLRLAVDRAKTINMPKDNIERAIQRGTGAGGGTALEAVVYEGFGPHQIPIIIETLTDNKNRTVAEIKHILEKNNGTLAGPGSVMWMFDKRGVISLVTQGFSPDKIEELQLKLIDAGAEDVQVGNEEIIIYTQLEKLQKVKENIEKLDVKIESAGIEYVAKPADSASKEIDEATKEKLQKLFDALDEHDDVGDYYTNLK